MDLSIQKIQPTLEGAVIDIPPVAEAKQFFPRDEMGDVQTAMEQGIRKISASLSGKKIAITVGSRGICRIGELVRCLIGELKKAQAQPFIVPAMGSHGGATTEGQITLLAGYGITEETMGVPIRGSMEAVQIGKTDAGVPVFCQKDALEADGVIVMNKVKPHADFKSDIESGLCKMMVIGLGKHKGATELHRRGFARMGELLEPCARLFLKRVPVILGIGILENAYDRLMDLEFVLPEELIEKEKKMLVRAKANIARLHMPVIDVLIINQIGKDISGEGMDPNVTGRPGSGLNEGFDAPDIHKIVVLGMTEKTHGNGVGIGMADVSTVELAEQIDLTQVYTNAVTSTLIGPARLPLLAATQRQAVDLALRTCNAADPESPRVVWIPNTLNLDKIYVSRGVALDVSGRTDIQVDDVFYPVSWTQEGRLFLKGRE